MYLALCLAFLGENFYVAYLLVLCSGMLSLLLTQNILSPSKANDTF